jgi:hypothetical protein
MLQTIEKYNIELNFWTVLGDIECPTPIQGPICFSFNEQYILIFGGFCPDKQVVQKKNDKGGKPQETQLEPVVNNSIYLMHIKQETIQDESNLSTEEFKMVHTWMNNSIC